MNAFHPPLTDQQQAAVDWCLEQAGANPDRLLEELVNRLHLSRAQKHRLALVLERGPSFEVMHVLGGEFTAWTPGTYDLSLQVPCTSTLHRLDVVGVPFRAVEGVIVRGLHVQHQRRAMPGDHESAEITLKGGRRLQAGEIVHVRLVVTAAELPFLRLPIVMRGVLEVARGPAGEVVDVTSGMTLDVLSLSRDGSRDATSAAWRR